MNNKINGKKLLAATALGLLLTVGTLANGLQDAHASEEWRASMKDHDIWEKAMHRCATETHELEQRLDELRTELRNTEGKTLDKLEGLRLSISELVFMDMHGIIMQLTAMEEGRLGLSLDRDEMLNRNWERTTPEGELRRHISDLTNSAGRDLDEIQRLKDELRQTTEMSN